ncbi:hypothetical protein SAMN05216360_103295 [Methylobacterium phyllostachyos]|uniref:Uncharacterized protein n=2 Tax=Methylobacterium phyllostachyos TaxID=582672 RepID=A0A1G9VTL3_9HYPH|nr:hypothetical protein SAMN05216360_103295 [Methylobacterium phyllostachyos]
MGHDLENATDEILNRIQATLAELGVRAISHVERLDGRIDRLDLKRR